MRKICAVTGWLLTLAILLLSVAPPSERPTTAAGSNVEHIAIYLLTGMMFGIGYPKRLLTVAIGLVVFSGIIEGVQLWVPGRHARLSDLAIDIAASCAGIVIVMIAEKLIWRRAEN